MSSGTRIGAANQKTSSTTATQRKKAPQVADGVYHRPSAPSVSAAQTPPSKALSALTDPSKPVMTPAQESLLHAKLVEILKQKNISPSEKKEKIAECMAAFKSLWLEEKVKEMVGQLFQTGLGVAGLTGGLAVLGFTFTPQYRDMVAAIKEQIIDTPAYQTVQSLMEEKVSLMAEAAQLRLNIDAQLHELRQKLEELKKDPKADRQMKNLLKSEESLSSAMAKLDGNDIEGALAELKQVYAEYEKVTNLDGGRMRGFSQRLREVDEKLKAAQTVLAAELEAAVRQSDAGKKAGPGVCEALIEELKCAVADATAKRGHALSQEEIREVSVPVIEEHFSEIDADDCHHLENQVVCAIEKYQTVCATVKIELLQMTFQLSSNLVLFVLDLQLKLERESLEAKREADAKQAEEDAVERKIADRKSDEAKRHEKAGLEKSAQRNAEVRSALTKGQDKNLQEKKAAVVIKPMERAENRHWENERNRISRERQHLDATGYQRKPA